MHISTPTHQMALDLQSHMCEVLKSLMRTERNQQVMCEAGLPHQLLAHCNITLADETHPLHPPIQYMFERLSAQSLTAKDLRWVFTTQLLWWIIGRRSLWGVNWQLLQSSMRFWYKFVQERVVILSSSTHDEDDWNVSVYSL